MKKSALILAIIILLPVLSAVELEMKDQYFQGETFSARLSGNFLDPVLKSNIFFYRGHVRVAIEYDLEKIEDEYYIYALLPEKNNNYTLSIENVRYAKGSQIADDDIQKTFEITNQTAEFSVSPGVINTNQNFFIQIQNLKDSKIIISTASTTSSGQEGGIYFANSAELKSGEIKKIDFLVKDIQESTFKYIEFKSGDFSYSIPVFLFANATADQKDKLRAFELDPSNFEVNMATSSDTTRIIYLYNTGENSLEDINLSVSNLLASYTVLSINEIEELEPDSNLKIEIYFTSGSEEEIVEGQITAKTKNDEIYTYSSIILNIIDDYVPENGEEPEIPPSTKTCSELGGVICASDEGCDSDERYAKDDLCCLGLCEVDNDSKNSIGTIIGWLILIIVIIFVGWFFLKKYRRAERKPDLFKEIKKSKKQKD
jgi:hypothetical protein